MNTHLSTVSKALVLKLCAIVDSWPFPASSNFEIGLFVFDLGC